MSKLKIFMKPESLSPRVDRLKFRGSTIVFANGCFELLHAGHIDYLEAAKALGDILIVAVNTDESMRMIKPDRRPANSDRDRLRIVAAFGAVDFVVPLEDRTPIPLIELFKPHVHTKGTDYHIDRIPEREHVERYGGRVVLVGGPKVRSTTDMLSHIRGRGPTPALCSTRAATTPRATP